MSTFTDKVRDKINEFLNDGYAEKRLIEVAQEEMESAIDEIRPELKTICQTAIKDALANFNGMTIVLDKDKINKLINYNVECMFDEWDDDIQRSLAQTLLDELKNVTILPKP